MFEHWWFTQVHEYAINGQAMPQTNLGGVGAGSVFAAHVGVQLHVVEGRDSQSVSWSQCPVPASVPASAAPQSPSCATATAAQPASHELGYVLPSTPQTGA